MKFSSVIEKILSLLRVRTVVGGLEVSDSVLRFAAFTNGMWRTAAVRLPPGILVDGAIKDKTEFKEALLVLKREITGSSDRKKSVNVVVSLSSINIYSQVFSLPVIDGENLEKAIRLNIQMASPGAAAQTYSGWELLGEDKNTLRIEVLSAFSNKALVDEIYGTLRDAGYVVASIESRALSLARLMRLAGQGALKESAFIVLHLDASGIDFLIIRRGGQLYFEYFTPWRDVLGEEESLSLGAYGKTIIRNLHQVLNYYNAHWPEPLTNIVLVASSLREETEKIMNENFSLTLTPASLTMSALPDEWFVVMGGALRGLTSPRKDNEISLLGVTAKEEFHEEQSKKFFGFWRVVAPLVMIFLVAIYGMGYFFIGQIEDSLTAREGRGLDAEKQQELTEATKQVEAFNQEVALIGSVRSLPSAVGFAKRVQALAAGNEITLTRFYLPSLATPALLNGAASTEEQIITFKKALENDGSFTGVNLPLTDIKNNGQALTFSMTFSIALSKTP